MLTLLVLSMFTFLLKVLPVKPDSGTWTVDDDGPADFSSIQDAIFSPDVMARDTIYVYNGLYYENVIINKTLTLIGEDKSNTIIDGSEPSETNATVFILADFVNMSDFTVARTEVGEGIHIEDSQYCEVHDNIVCYTDGRGIVSVGGGNNKVYNNIVHDTGGFGGIEAIYSDNNTFYNNTAYFNQWGVATNHGSYNRIYNNTVYDNYGSGIHIDWPSAGNMVFNNNVSSNAAAGIAVMNQANETVIEGNKISGSFWGINLLESSNDSIFGNTITANQGGVSLFESSKVTINENDITNNEVGILLGFDSNDNIICGNTIMTSYNNSIVISHSSMNKILENILTSNSNGIQIHDSSNSNTISENIITNNGCGVEIRASVQNKFFHNNFIGNTQQVAIVTPDDFNVWDDAYPSGGNYWSDYVGIDVYNGPYQNETGSDGTGDTPYVIGDNNQDNYPLIEPWYGEEFITIGTTATITVLDPAVAYLMFDWEIFNNIGEGLLKYKPGTTDLISGIAKNYTISPDGLNYTFNLREGMYFTDGEPLDAAAVKWSIDRVAYLNLDPSRLVSDFVDSVEVVNNLTVKFILKKAASFFPALVTTTPYFPVSSKSYPANETAEPTVGHYGPYKIKSWTRDAELVLEANPNYYGAQPRSRYVVIKFFSNATMMRQALENGRIDMAWLGLRPMDIVELRENPDFNIVESHDSIIRYLTLRCDMMPFDDVRLRRAVAAAINRTRICAEAYMGTVDPLYSMVPMGMWSHINAFKDEYGVRNLTLSRQLLAEAGYGESEKFVFDLWYYSAYADTAAIIKSDLEETGMINVTLIGASLAEILENMPEGIMQSFLLGWLPDYLDPDAFLTPFVYSDLSPELGVFYNSTAMDSILDEATVEPNMTVRTELYENAQRLLAEDAPLVPFCQGTLYAVAKPNIKGIYLSPTSLLPYYTIYKHTPSTRYPWPMFHNNLRHTGYTESPAPNTNQTLWNFTTGGLLYGPVVADSRVYVGSGDKNVYCLDALTGVLIWNYTTGDWVGSSPAVVDGRVYVGSDDRNVYCLDALTGAQIWNYTTGYWVFSSPAVADGKVYVGSCDNKVYCLDALTGILIWNYTTGNFVRSCPAVVDGKVYVGSDDNKTYCLDALTGAQIWNYTTSGFVGSSPAVVDGRVYVGSGDKNVYCLDALTGVLIWNYTTGSYVFSSPAVVDGKAYVGSCDNKVYCLDALTGAQIWNYTTGYCVTSSPAVADGKVYIGSYDFNVYCLNASTGAKIWSYKTGDCVHSSAAVADGMVYVGSDDHTVYAFGNVIRVPQDFPTVQEAVYVAESGATIIVAPGIYYESVVINKSVTIIGLPGSDPIFDGGGSGIGFTITGTSEVTITGIVITNYAQAIVIDDSSNCKIYNNIMTQNAKSGIETNNAANNLIYNNIFQENCGTGACAISLTQYSTGTTIYNNTIILNSIGLNIASSGNTIYWNIFIDNTKQVQAVALLSNNWDNGYPDGGNYWSGYTGVDEKSGPSQNLAGSDGIGDTPYTIDVPNNIIDGYPLMKPFSQHDIGITNVIPSKTIVGQGFTLRIDLKILNFGIHNELFTATIYADATIIATQTISLTRRNCTTVTFTWNTSGFVKGNYTIKAIADTIPGEVDTTDNTYMAGHIIVAMVGDIVPDGTVDIFDLVYVALSFGAECGKPPPPGTQPYEPNADLNGDGIIDIFDIVTVALHYGETDP